jgi:hypothetical protein
VAAPVVAGEMSSDFAPTMLPNAATVWRSAIEEMSPHASPCRYLTPGRWVPIREAAIDFCDRLGAEAYALGWTAAELFALHPEHGTLRLEVCGVMMITDNRAQAVEPARVVFERGSAYRTEQGQVWGFSLGVRQEGHEPVNSTTTRAVVQITSLVSSPSDRRYRCRSRSA